MDSNWTYSNAVPRNSHFLIAFYFAFFFAIARLLLDRFVFRRVATWLLSIGSTRLKINEARRVKITKCSESLWKLAYYTTVEFCVLKAISNEPWFRNIEYFSGWPNAELKWHKKLNIIVPHSIIFLDLLLPAGPALKLIYMCQCGFYIYSMTALVTWETRRKDFSVMMSHHVVTVILISVSYITRFFNIGSVILALHDASDVFLEAAKVFKYSEKEFGASVCFGLFAVSWLLLRLVFFPIWVIRYSSYHLLDILKLENTFDMSLYYIFNTMLLTLLVFHIYWWYLICAMIMRQLKNQGKVGEDIRSDSEDDE